MNTIVELSTAVEEGLSREAEELTSRALDEGLDALDVLNEALVPAMERVGTAFEEGDVFLPGVLLAAQAMKAAMSVLSPLLKERDGGDRGTVVIGTVQGDQHDIGKNLVSVLFEGAGFNVIDLGCDVPDEQFVERAEKERADIVAMSALLNNTMTRMKSVIESLERKGLRDRVKVIVGGAPLDEDFAASIGADAYASDGVAAVATARMLLARAG